MSVVVDVSQPIGEISLPPVPGNEFWRLSLKQYHEMVNQGILTEDDPVELWEGLLVPQITIVRPPKLESRQILGGLPIFPSRLQGVLRWQLSRDGRYRSSETAWQTCG